MFADRRRVSRFLAWIFVGIGVIVLLGHLMSSPRAQAMDDFGSAFSPHIPHGTIKARSAHAVGLNTGGHSATLAQPSEVGAAQLYRQGRYAESLDQWTQALERYLRQGDRLPIPRILSNIALAHQKLGQWQEAQDALDQSLSTLGTLSSAHRITSPDLQQQMAQVLNTQAGLYFAKGRFQDALETWDDAISAYTAANDAMGQLRAHINQAQALQALGHYRQAISQLRQIREQLHQLSEPDHDGAGASDRLVASSLDSLRLMQTTVLRQLGDNLRLVGDLEQARPVLEEGLAIANRSPSSPAAAPLLLSLGQLDYQQNEGAQALHTYQLALQQTSDPSLVAKIALAQLQALIDAQSWLEAQRLWLDINQSLDTLPGNRDTLSTHLVLAHQFFRVFGHGLPSNGLPNNGAFNNAASGRDDGGRDGVSPAAVALGDAPSLSWEQGRDLLHAAVRMARQMGDQRSEAYAIGYLGQLYERQGQWAVARRLTEQSLLIDAAVGGMDDAYRWLWQRARILTAQQRLDEAIAAYQVAVDAVALVRSVGLPPYASEVFQFQTDVEPLYQDFVRLLLTLEPEGQVSQAHLRQARDVMEAFQVAELDNFFQEACLEDAQFHIDNVDPSAAVLYTMVLSDRLDVILGLPDEPLQHYSTPISPLELNHFIEDLQHSLVIRSRFDYRPQTRQLYDWLVRPGAASLEAHQIKTLVFVLGGSLRQIPMAVLNDGSHYLVETYQVAIAPKFTINQSRTQFPASGPVLLAGLSQSRHGFSPLRYVQSELDAIDSRLSGRMLLDETFTRQRFSSTVEHRSYPLVHIASHGQFGSKPQDTFIVAWDRPLNILDLQRILQAPSIRHTQEIDLLVLSACESAAGDQRAPLGLAGMAIRSGAHSTLATLWAVNDAVTAQFMAQFYKNLSLSMTKAEALRQSQLWLMQHERFSHPLYWAPYVMVGDWQ